MVTVLVSSRYLELVFHILRQIKYSCNLFFKSEGGGGIYASETSTMSTHVRIGDNT